MPVTYRIDQDKRLICTRCVGNVTFAEVVEHFQTLSRDPDCPETLDVLLDLSELKSLPEARQLENLALEIQKIHMRVKFGACAIVAQRDALFGMMRMFEVIGRSHFREIRTFREMAEAERWLASPEAATG